MTPIGHYAALLAAVRARLAELNVSHECIDAIAGWAPGYASKVLCVPPIKHLSAFTMFMLMQALGLRLAIEPDAEALAVVADRLQQRDCPARYAWRSRDRDRIVLLSRDLLVNRAVNGGYARARKLSKKQLSRIGRAGARARWRKAGTQ